MAADPAAGKSALVLRATESRARATSHGVDRDLPVTHSLKIPAAELSFTAVASGGPGGQNVNKVATKVELRFDVARSRALPERVKQRLLALAGSRVDAEGCLVIVDQETRSQARNLELARQRQAGLVRAALVPPKPRRATRPSGAAKRRRLESKRLQAQKKQARRSVKRDE